MKHLRNEYKFINAVETLIPDEIPKENWNFEFIFEMEGKEGDIYINLETLMLCLKEAEKKGAVPDLPVEWWNQVLTRLVIDK